MKYKKFHKLIEENTAEQKQAVYQKLQQDLALPEDASPDQKRNTVWQNLFKKPAHLVACLSTAVAVVCLAIILPIALNDGGGTPTPPNRYTSGHDSDRLDMDCTLKEYAQQNGLSMLYVDWYDIADNVNTALYVNPSDHDDVYYYEEFITHAETGYTVYLDVTDLFTRVDILERFEFNCDNEEIIKGVSVHWYGDNVTSRACFEYGDYRYFVELLFHPAKDIVLEIVQSMLP